MEKTIKEVFKDYNSKSIALNDSKIKTINLFKKTNKLELKLIASGCIKIADLYDFERYLEKRFDIKEVIIEIEYENKTEVDLKLEWPDIVKYMAFKHPLIKALLKDSNIEIQEKNLIVNLPRKGKETLDAGKFDKTLEDIIFNIYGKIKSKICRKYNRRNDAKVKNASRRK